MAYLTNNLYKYKNLFQPLIAKEVKWQGEGAYALLFYLKGEVY